MNTTPFFRILWREYRGQRAFCISVAAATIMLVVALRVDPWIDRADRPATILAAALVVAALSALGLTATLFATERENETYDILRALPVGPWTVFFGKAVFAVCSAAAMFAFGWTLALLVARGLPDAREHRDLCADFGAMAVEFSAWGLFFSLLCRRTIVAACLAGTATVLVLTWCVNHSGSLSGSMESQLWRTMPTQLLIAGLVMVADLILAGRWLQEKLLQSPARVRSASLSTRFVSGNRLGPLGRLVWQETRQSAVLAAAILAMLLPMGLAVWMQWLAPAGMRAVDRWWEFNFMQTIFVTCALAAYLAPVMLGSTIFQGDQSSYHFRFLAERGLPPRLVWLSRHIRGLAVVLIGVLVFVPPTVALILYDPRFTPPESRRELVLIFFECGFGYVAVAYACGQLCSMLIRSGILAVFAGTVATAAICAWAWLMFFFGLSWWWTVAPLPVACLAATWLHAPNWLVERKTWRARLRPILAIAVPALAILAAIPFVRVYEIPWVEPGFDPAEVIRPVSAEEKKVHGLYSQAIDLLPETRSATPAERGAEARAIELALEASCYPLPEFRPGPDEHRFTYRGYGEMKLAEAVFADGIKCQADGKLDAALDRYLAANHIALHVRQISLFPEDTFVFEIRVCERLTIWAAERGQKSRRVLKAMRAFQEQRCNSLANRLEYWYQPIRRTLEGDRQNESAAYPLSDSPNFSQWSMIARWLPWERNRAVRALNWLTAAEIERDRQIDVAIAAGGAVPPVSDAREREVLSRDHFTFGLVKNAMRDLGSHTLLFYEKYCRATRLVLALEAWRIDHGRLPGSLDALLGKYLDKLPVDPATGSAFQYERNGVPQRVEWDIPSTSPENLRAIEPGQPFVGVPYTPPGPYYTFDQMNTFRNGVWTGWVFPVPPENSRAVPPAEAPKEKPAEPPKEKHEVDEPDEDI